LQNDITKFYCTWV